MHDIDLERDRINYVLAVMLSPCSALLSKINHWEFVWCNSQDSLSQNYAWWRRTDEALNLPRAFRQRPDLLLVGIKPILELGAASGVKVTMEEDSTRSIHVSGDDGSG